jgi:hypothetical protein
MGQGQRFTLIILRARGETPAFYFFMINEKIDHHFNELSPIDFNIFDAKSLYDKLQKEQPDYAKAEDLLDYVSGIKEQIESLLNHEDEQLKVTYGFLSEEEQEDYLEFLKTLQQEIAKFLKTI